MQEENWWKEISDTLEQLPAYIEYFDELFIANQRFSQAV